MHILQFIHLFTYLYIIFLFQYYDAWCLAMYTVADGPLVRPVAAKCYWHTLNSWRTHVKKITNTVLSGEIWLSLQTMIRSQNVDNVRQVSAF